MNYEIHFLQLLYLCTKKGAIIQCVPQFQGVRVLLFLNYNTLIISNLNDLIVLLLKCLLYTIYIRHFKNTQKY
jgi:hypothetical protein